MKIIIRFIMGFGHLEAFWSLSLSVERNYIYGTDKAQGPSKDTGTKWQRNLPLTLFCKCWY